LTVETCRL